MRRSIMSISRKNKREFIYQDRIYYWFVAEDGDYCGEPILTMVSQDRRIILHFVLGQNEPSIFVEKSETLQHGHYSLPFREEGAITPGFIKNLLSWLGEQDETLPQMELKWSFPKYHTENFLPNIDYKGGIVRFINDDEFALDYPIQKQLLRVSYPNSVLLHVDWISGKGFEIAVLREKDDDLDDILQINCVNTVTEWIKPDIEKAVTDILEKWSIETVQ